MKTPLLLLLFCFLFGQSQQNFSFDGKALITLTDADMVATALSDGQLKKQEAIKDQLHIINLVPNSTELPIKQTEVPNTVLTWPSSLELSKDGKVAFVAETRQSPMEGIQKVENVKKAFPEGRNIYAVDLEKPSIITVVDVGILPNAIQMSHSGKTLAVVTEQYTEEIVLIEWDNGVFGNIQAYPSGKQDIRATNISWHPSDKFIAVTLEEAGQVAFYKIVETASYTLVETLGNPIEVGSLPGAGHFSPNGQHYIIPNVEDGEMVVIDFDETDGNHKVNNRLAVGTGNEGFSLSADGKLLAVACTDGTHYPINHPKWTPESSLYLLSFDPSNGKLAIEDQVSILGILPQNIVFDADGDMLAVTVFQNYDLTQQRGGIAFWNIIDKEGKKKLKPSIFSATLPRGCHGLKLVK